MPTIGRPRFDGIAVMQLEASFIEGVKLRAKAAFFDSKTGKTHGSTSASTELWSPETLEALEALRTALERDLARRDLEESTPAEGPSNARGIGEWLHGDAEPL